jgi:YjgF/chorismate_mutase-like, putative endoribonuclease
MKPAIALEPVHWQGEVVGATRKFDSRRRAARQVGEALSIEQGAAAARLVGLAMLGSLQRELGNLERISAWLRVFGMVNVAPGTTQVAAVVNGFLIVEVFGKERGGYSRSAVGMAELPFGVAVEIEAEVEIE